MNTKSKQTIQEFLQEKLAKLYNEHQYHLNNNNIEKALSILDQINLIDDIKNERI